MITFDLFYQKFCQDNYFPSELHAGRFKAESIEEIDSKIEQLNKRASWDESHYVPHNWHYEIVPDEIPHFRNPHEFFKIALIVSFNLWRTNYNLDVHLSTYGVEYDNAMSQTTPGTKYTELLSERDIREVRLYTFIEPDKYSNWLELYDGELEEALQRAEHYINWAVDKEKVKNNLLNEINHLRKNLKARKGKFKYF